MTRYFYRIPLRNLELDFGVFKTIVVVSVTSKKKNKNGGCLLKTVVGAFVTMVIYPYRVAVFI